MSYFDYADDEQREPDFGGDEDDYENARTPGFTVAMKGAPNMATVQWCSTEADAIKKTAREWGCKESDCYIYRGHDE